MPRTNILRCTIFSGSIVATKRDKEEMDQVTFPLVSPPPSSFGVDWAQLLGVAPFYFGRRVGVFDIGQRLRLKCAAFPKKPVLYWPADGRTT